MPTAIRTQRDPELTLQQLLRLLTEDWQLLTAARTTPADLHLPRRAFWVSVASMGAYHLRLACFGALALACGNTDNDNDNNNGSDGSESATTRASTSSTPSSTSGQGTNGTGGTGAGTSTTNGMGTGGDNTGGGSTNDTTSSGGSSAAGSAGAAGAPDTGGTGSGEELPIDGPVDIVEDCGFSACGGELGGSSWRYARVCVEEGALFSGLTQLCEAIELGEVTGTVTGTLSFDTTSYTEDVTVSIAASLLVPASCGLASCALAQVLAAAAGLPGTVCTSAGAGDCECTAPITITSDTTGDYTASGGELKRDDQTGAYCTSQDSLEFTASQQDIEFIYELVPW